MQRDDRKKVPPCAYDIELPARRTFSQFWSIKISRATFLSYIK